MKAKILFEFFTLFFLDFHRPPKRHHTKSRAFKNNLNSLAEARILSLKLLPTDTRLKVKGDSPLALVGVFPRYRLNSQAVALSGNTCFSQLDMFPTNENKNKRCVYGCTEITYNSFA